MQHTTLYARHEYTRDSCALQVLIDAVKKKGQHLHDVPVLFGLDVGVVREILRRVCVCAWARPGSLWLSTHLPWAGKVEVVTTEQLQATLIEGTHESRSISRPLAAQVGFDAVHQV